MIEYKVLIPSAGLGTRLGELSKNRNKALVTVGQKPAICHIIDKFPKEVEIVVALGHMGDLTKQFLSLAYPDRKITCVEIKKYMGPGSGLGRTVLDCAEHLQCPFVFCSNDTIVREKIPAPTTDWVGYDERDDISQYRTISTFRDRVISLNEKADRVWEEGVFPYIGLAGIHNYELFWDYMKDGINKGAIEIGESYGLRVLLATLEPKKFTWMDTGNKEALVKAIKDLTPKNAPNILPKENEDIWFVNNRVVKYHIDETFIKKRVERTKVLGDFVPEIEGSTNNMYSYKMVQGKVMSSVLNRPVFEDFLKFMKEFWEPVKLSSEDEELSFREMCKKFYKDKTYKRVESYFERFNYKDKEEIINGEKVPKVMELLEKVDWEILYQGSSFRSHGDLHFENVLVSEDYSFVLLDWRQDFAGCIEYGDIYYDLAKLLHGIIVSHEIVNKDLFEIEVDGNIVNFDILRSLKLSKAESLLEKFVTEGRFSWKKVRLLTALIYLNIAPLHHYPYSEFLFYLGKDMLAEVLDES